MKVALILAFVWAHASVMGWALNRIKERKNYL